MRRRFVIRAAEGISIGYGVALATALARHMPLASLQFLPESHYDPAGLREGRIDLDLGSGHRKDPELVVQILNDRSLLGAVAMHHPLARAEVTVERFAAARHVEVASHPGDESVVDAALGEHGLQRSISLVVPSVFSALIVCARSDLAACAPERTAYAMGAALELRLFPLPLRLPATPLRLAWHPRLHADPAHCWLRDTLLAALKKGPEEQTGLQKQ